jgi:iron complex transport system permease protein
VAVTPLERRAPVPPGATSVGRPPGAARRVTALVAVTGLLVLTVVASLALGSRSLPTLDVLRVIVEPDGSDTSLIVRELRLPRTVVGLVVGAALGLAGAQLQGLTRNPLADPGLLGVSAGAAVGIVVLATAGVTAPGPALLGALAGALLATVAVWTLGSTGRRGSDPVTLLLAGVAVTALLSSVTTVLVLLDASTLDQYRFWLVGSLSGRDPGLLLPAAPLLAVGLVLGLAAARTLDAIALGDDLARGLGTRLASGRAAAAIGAMLLIAAAVSVAGPVTFVGLVVPHVARAVVGPSHRWLLPLSLLLGAVLLLASDILGRLIARPGEVQAGVVTALVGAPFLVALVRRRRVVSA